MSKHRHRSLDIAAPLTDPPIPTGEHRGIAAEDRADFKDCDYIEVDGMPFAVVEGPGRPGRVTPPRAPVADEDIPF